MKIDEGVSRIRRQKLTVTQRAAAATTIVCVSEAFRGARETREKNAKGDERCGLGDPCHIARPDIGRGTRSRAIRRLTLSWDALLLRNPAMSKFRRVFARVAR